MRISNNTHSLNVNSKIMMTLPPNPSNNQQSQNSKSCKKCCKCPDYSENSKFQTPFTPIPNTADSSTYSSDDIIKSPLDQRLYKSITLTNGIRVMLISTIEVDSNDDAVDATKTPCQVPGLADFNKTYLGFDNPAARVKCACPCDKRKPCCGMGCGKDANRKSILKEFENIKAACCAKQDRPSSADKRVSFQDDQKTLASFRNEVERPSNPDYFNNYQAALFDAMNRRAQRRKIKQASANYKQHEREKGDTKETQGQEIDENHRNFNQKAMEKHEETPASRLDKERQKRSMNLKNCHNFQSYSRGLHGTHSVSTKTRPRINRPKFTSSIDYDSDLEASAYLVIGAGYFDDPLDQVGLAHFCEHCVFLGSRFFPEPDMLSRLVSPFGGFANAYTSGMMTTFYTSTPPMLFPLAVEILGDMIGFPLFPLELVTAELEALDSEYSFRHDDEPEYFQLLASLAKDGHAMKKNSGGNMSTIKVPNFYRRLVEWKRVYYNPKRITVALEAPLPLDYLERLAILSFGEIASSTLQPCITNRYLLQNSPFEMSRFHQIYHVPSVYPSEYLILHWTLESKAWKNLRVKPLEYLAAIMEHKCEGGLFHYLTTQGLATQITAGCWESDTTRNHFTSVFAIQVSMTEKGFKRQDNILQAIFGYIQMLISARPQQTFFQEIQKQALDSFHYNGAKGTHSVAEMLSKWMQFIPPKWCLISPVLITNFDEEFIHRYTESLKIETVNVMIFSKKYHGAEYIRNRSMDDKNAPAFTAFQFPQELEEKIRRTLTKYAAHFTLPPPNPLLLDTKCSRSRKQDLLEVGKLYKDDCLTVSYTDRKMHMTKGLLPQARYSWWIISEVTSVARVHPKLQDAVQACMLLMTGLFNEMFETKFYHTCNADILLQASVFEGQLNVFFEGPYTALPSVMEQLVEIFDEFEDVLDEIQFEAGRTTFINLLDDAILDNQLLAWDLFDYLWTNDHPLIFDLKSLLERLTLAEFVDFVKAFKERMLIDLFLAGYVTKAQGERVLNSLKKLKYEPIDVDQQPISRCLRLPRGERVIRVNSQNPSVHTSVVINSYQFGMLTVAEEEVVNFLSQTMSEAAFNQLRTEEQLGYYVDISADVTFEVSSIVIELVTQPKNFTTEYCNECIDNFLLDFFTNNLADEKAFQSFSLAKPKVELPFSLIQRLFASYLLPNPFTYRKLSIQVVGAVPDTQSPLELTNIENIDDTSQKIPQFTPKNQVRRIQSVGAQTTIDKVRAAKKSMQMKGDSFSTDGDKNNRQSERKDIKVKVVTDLAKFKRTLMYNSFDSKRLIQN